MKLFTDSRLIGDLRTPQRGVFSTADLKTALNEKHPAAFGTRIRALVNNGILMRFTRGFYVTEDFSLETLSQRIAPQSCISFGTVLANSLVIGTKPTHRILSTKVGPTRSYKALGFEIMHLGIAQKLAFGYEVRDGIRFASTEKAILDVLYFHLRGRKFPFDIYSDLNLGRLNLERVRECLLQYTNPKFVTFAKNVLEIK